jgi:hypothetical protein
MMLRVRYSHKIIEVAQSRILEEMMHTDTNTGSDICDRYYILSVLYVPMYPVDIHRLGQLIGKCRNQNPTT